MNVPFRALVVVVAATELGVLVGLNPIIPSGDKEVLVVTSEVVFDEDDGESTTPDDVEGVAETVEF